MSHALKDLLADRFNEEPPEIAIIKEYVQKNLDEAVAVAIRGNQIIISTRSSALAGALRPHLHQLTKLCGVERRLIIRIG